jgi:hypothetical protein
MDRYGGPHTALTIAFNGDIYSAIIMDRRGVPFSALNIALHGDLYIAIIMEPYGGPHTDHTAPLWRAWHFPSYRLAYIHLVSHYNEPL